MQKKTEQERDVRQACYEACPLGKFFSGFGEKKGGRSDFLQHVGQSQVEMLKAVRSLVDLGIEYIEQMTLKKGEKKATKIEVE